MEPAHSRAFEVITFVPFDGGDGWMNKPASAKCITRFLTPDQTFPSPALFFFLFRSRAQTDSLADLYQIFPNTLKRLYERKKVNIILYAPFRTIRDIAGASSCVILHSLNSKILILMKNERHEGNFISRDPREVSFLPPPSRNFPSSQSYKNTFVKMYMG